MNPYRSRVLQPRAKQKVIGDIKAYFKDRLSVELELFAANTSRTNLHYEVYNNGSDEEKYNVCVIARI